MPSMKPLTDITVLIAEDERPVRMLLRVVLESAGARVLEAEDGVRALRLLDLHPEIRLLCTDVNMPNLDGHGLVRAIRDRYANLPVVACTALDLDGNGSQLALTVDAIVQKPFVPSDLVRTVHDALERSRTAFAAS